MKNRIIVFGMATVVALFGLYFVKSSQQKYRGKIVNKAYNACLIIADKLENLAPEIVKFNFIRAFPPKKGGKSLGYPWEGTSFLCISDTVIEGNSKIVLRMWVKYSPENDTAPFYTNEFFPVALQKRKEAKKPANAPEHDFSHIDMKMLWALEPWAMQEN